MITDLRRFESFVSHEIQICQARSAMHFGWMWAFKLNTSCAESRPLSNSNCHGTTSVPCKGSQVDVLYRKKAHARKFSSLSTLAWLRCYPWDVLDIRCGVISFTSIPDISAAPMKLRRPKQYCVKIWGNLYTWQWLWVFMGPSNHLKNKLTFLAFVYHPPNICLFKVNPTPFPLSLNRGSFALCTYF